MSKVKCTLPEVGFLGWTDANGVHQESKLSPGDEFPSDAPIVVARPDLFTASEAPAAETPKAPSTEAPKGPAPRGR